MLYSQSCLQPGSGCIPLLLLGQTILNHAVKPRMFLRWCQLVYAVPSFGIQIVFFYPCNELNYDYGFLRPAANAAGTNSFGLHPNVGPACAMSIHARKMDVQRGAIVGQKI